MQTSEAGVKLLMDREGVRTKAYKDSVGVWTIGVGHTAAAGPPDPRAGLTITRAQALALLANDLKSYEAAVNTAVKRPLTQNQFDACVSLCFNIGQGGFKKSTVVKRINAGDMRGAADAFMMWVKPPELRGRRAAEKLQFLTPYKSSTAPRPAPPAPRPADPEEQEIAANNGGRVVTPETLAAAGSRTIAATASAKQSVIVKGGVLGGGLLTEGITHMDEASGAAQSALDALTGARGVAETLASHWQVYLTVALVLVVGWSLWRVWRAQNAIEAARVEDELAHSLRGL